MPAVRASVRSVTGIAVTLAVTIAVALPAGYLFLSYHRLADALEMEAGLIAQAVTRYVNANPALWQYEQARLEGTLQRASARPGPELRRIYDQHGHRIVASGGRPGRPVVRGDAVIYDAGRPVGRVEIIRSMRDFAAGASAVAVLSVLLGALIYAVLHRFPLAALRRSVGELYEERERARVTLDAISDAVVTTDSGGRVVLLNGAATRLAGVPPGEAVGRSFGALFPLASAVGDPWLPPWGREASANQEGTWTLAAAGDRRTVSLTVAALGGPEAGRGGWVVALRDVTEWKRMEDELSRAQRLESLGVLAGGIAHDFNNLLAVVVGNVDLASAGVADRPAVADRLAAAATACEQARDLTRQLLTFSRGGAPLRETVDLTQVIRNTAEFASRGGDAALWFDLAPDLWPVEADPGQISQVLQNLVINAQQASPGGGVIRVQARNVEGADDRGPGGPGRRVRISLSDQGEGIAAEHLGRIFDPYFTTKTGGSGLGLATVHSIVQRHRGRIEVSSAPGRGTRFDIELPAASGSPAPSGAVGSAPQAPAGPTGGRILLMDDDEPVRHTATRIFEHLGYEVAATADGREALERYEAARAEGRPFDLVVLDLTVPGGMGGEETVQRLKDRHPDALVVASSGYSDEGAVAQCRSRGFDECLSKPYRLDQVRATLAALPSRRAGTRAPSA